MAHLHGTKPVTSTYNTSQPMQTQHYYYINGSNMKHLQPPAGAMHPQEHTDSPDVMGSVVPEALHAAAADTRVVALLQCRGPTAAAVAGWCSPSGDVLMCPTKELIKALTPATCNAVHIRTCSCTARYTPEI